MSLKPLLISIFLIIASALIIYAQEEPLPTEVIETEEIDPELFREKPDFWLSLGAETALYGISGLAYGGSFALGYGSGSLIGFKAALFFIEDGNSILELDLLLRFYLFGKDAYRGPFIQLAGGPSLFNRSGSFAIPSELGMVNAGLSFGWRFIFIERFFVEPAVRAGYPYFWGASVCAGIRF
jgi:hypothetical protein